MYARTFIYIIMWVSAIAWSIAGNAQDNANDTIQVAMYVKIDRAYYQGDSIPNMTLHEFYKTANLYGMKYYTNFSNLKWQNPILYKVFKFSLSILIASFKY